MTEKDGWFDEELSNHCDAVHHYMSRMILEASKRAQKHEHDKSKRVDPERKTFLEFVPKLKATAYGSDEYKEYLKGMGSALAHHYGHNRHHPEHFENGIEGMNLVDLMEMLADWKAATFKHEDGDMEESMKINVKRFGISPQLAKILFNTLCDFGM